MESETCCNQEDTNVIKVEENSRPVFKSVSRRWLFSPAYKRKMTLDNNDYSKIRRTSKSKDQHTVWSFSPAYKRKMALDNDYSEIRRTSKSKDQHTVCRDFEREKDFSGAYEKMMALYNDNSSIQGTSKSKEVKSCVAHFAYDFTGSFPRRISNIVEEEVDSLCEQMGGMDTESASQEKGNVKLNDTQEWKDGIIPYKLHFPLNFFNKRRILRAMKTIEEYSRMRFVERSYEDTYLKLTIGKGCFFQRGDGFRQPRVCLGRGREDFGTVLHELMHVIGFPHEQRRPDRDDYVTIHWENIIEGREHEFWKLKRHEYKWSEFPFDFDSIMLYYETAFGKNGLKTMEAKNGKTMYRKTNLSEIDKRKLLSL